MKLLGIDVGRQKERDRDGSKERIFVDKYVGGGGTKPRSGRDRYEIQNMVDVAIGPVAVKPHRSSTETCVYLYLYYTDYTGLRLSSCEIDRLVTVSLTT